MAKKVMEYLQFDRIGDDFVERDLSGIENSLCHHCEKCKRDCSGMDTLYTGCIFVKAAPYVKRSYPGCGEQWTIPYDPALTFEENLEIGRKFSGNAEYTGRMAGNPDRMIFQKREVNTPQ